MATETKLPVTKKPSVPTLVEDTWRPFGALIQR
ncbi:hypothetical protein ABIE85_002179 [Bradyrhizobium diazoefficiens]|nr:hypothetical protein [Bradyrhizobium japonicum]